jgi:hypothetical protein
MTLEIPDRSIGGNKGCVTTANLPNEKEPSMTTTLHRGIKVTVSRTHVCKALADAGERRRRRTWPKAGITSSSSRTATVILQLMRFSRSRRAVSKALQTSSRPSSELVCSFASTNSPNCQTANRKRHPRQRRVGPATALSGYVRRHGTRGGSSHFDRVQNRGRS